MVYVCVCICMYLYIYILYLYVFCLYLNFIESILYVFAQTSTDAITRSRHRRPTPWTDFAHWRTLHVSGRPKAPHLHRPCASARTWLPASPPWAPSEAQGVALCRGVACGSKTAQDPLQTLISGCIYVYYSVFLFVYVYVSVYISCLRMYVSTMCMYEYLFVCVCMHLYVSVCICIYCLNE